MTFPTTNWTQLAEATRLGDESGRRALGQLCEDYRKPVASYLRARGVSESEVDDAVQDFLLKLINSEAWKKADRTKGRFRSYLLTILNNMMKHAVRNRHRQKRGGGIVPESLDVLQDDGHDFAHETVEGAEMYDREWALTVVESGMRAVQEEFHRRGQAREFETLRKFLPGVSAPPSYEAAAQALDFSATSIKAAVYRLRRRYREVLRTEVARTVSAPHEVDEELRYLGRLLMRTDKDPQAPATRGNDALV